jgi:c-di-GMP phosphodiesterase Gmr
MPSQPAIESTEDLREALFALRREHGALSKNSSQAQLLLDALDSLLGLELNDDPFARVFASLRKVFTFSQAMMLAEPAGPAPCGDLPLECIVADSDVLVGSTWPVGPLFRKVMDGRVVATFSNDGVEEWREALRIGLLANQSALYVPVRVRERRGILVLLRALDDEGFDRNHVALARRFSVLASHALAARFARSPNSCNRANRSRSAMPVFCRKW